MNEYDVSKQDNNGGFHPVATKRASEIIYDQIREKIIRGELMPGDRLPNERELMELFRRSRPTIREALRILENNGYIQTTPGSGGSVVRERSEISVGPIIEEAVQSGFISLAAMSEYRTVCESASVEWAALRRTEEDLAMIRETLDQMKASAGSLSRFSLLDQDFHLAVAKASHNEVAVLMVRSMASFNSGFMEDKLRLMDEKDTKKMCARVCEQHLEIYKGIAAGDRKAARQAMKSHLEGFQNDLRTDTAFI